MKGSVEPILVFVSCYVISVLLLFTFSFIVLVLSICLSMYDMYEWTYFGLRGMSDRWNRRKRVKYESNPVFIAHNTWGFAIFTTTADPVCIVGAGPAGLTVANKLQVTRLETVIFEKNSGVSGKCQVYYNEFQVAQFKVCTVRINVVNLITISAPLDAFREWWKQYLVGWQHNQPCYSILSITTATSNPLFYAEIYKQNDFWNTVFPLTTEV
jgi:hypothetical protein